MNGIKEFIEFYGDKLPNPDQNPKQFAFYVKMYKFLKANERRKREITQTKTEG